MSLYYLDDETLSSDTCEASAALEIMPMNGLSLAGNKRHHKHTEHISEPSDMASRTPSPLSKQTPKKWRRRLTASYTPHADAKSP